MLESILAQDIPAFVMYCVWNIYTQVVLIVYDIHKCTSPLCIFKGNDTIYKIYNCIECTVRQYLGSMYMYMFSSAHIQVACSP